MYPEDEPQRPRTAYWVLASFMYLRSTFRLSVIGVGRRSSGGRAPNLSAGRSIFVYPSHYALCARMPLRTGARKECCKPTSCKVRLYEARKLRMLPSSRMPVRCETNATALVLVFAIFTCAMPFPIFRCWQTHIPIFFPILGPHSRHVQVSANSCLRAWRQLSFVAPPGVTLVQHSHASACKSLSDTRCGT